MIAWLEGVLREKTPTRVVVDVARRGLRGRDPALDLLRAPRRGQDASRCASTPTCARTRSSSSASAPRASATSSSCCCAPTASGRGWRRRSSPGSSPATCSRPSAPATWPRCARCRASGQKMAERIVLELRDRAGELRRAGARPRRRRGRRPRRRARRGSGARPCVNLGYPRAQAERVVECCARGARATEARARGVIRAALRRRCDDRDAAAEPLGPSALPEERGYEERLRPRTPRRVRRARTRCARTSASSSARPASGASRSTTCSSTARPASARPRSRTSWPARWAPSSASPAAR